MKKHILYWLEIYAYLPIAIGVMVAGIFGMNWLTGRPVLDSPEVIIGWLYNAIGILIVVALTGLTQRQLFGYRAEYPAPCLKDDLHDSAVTLCLLALFSWLLFH